MARAEAITTAEEAEASKLLTYRSAEEEARSHSPPSLVGSRYQITHRKFEVNQLCQIFLGIRGRRFYEICIAIYMYAALWSYSAVFAQSMASHIPFPTFSSDGWMTCDIYDDHSWACHMGYIMYIAIFAIIVVPLTCLDLTEQKLLQNILAVFRFAALFLMIAVIGAAINNDPYSSGQSYTSTKGPYIASNWSLIRLAGFAIMVPCSLYSQIMHHSTPGLVQPVRDKTKLRKIFAAVFTSTYAFYAGLGIVLALYYGDNIQPACNLNFASFRGGAAPGSPIPAWAKFVTYVVVLFPAIDVCSAFPLNAITLANNVMAAFVGEREGPLDNLPRKRKVPFRLLAALPPLIGAALEPNLATILSYAGLVGFLIAFLIPALLELKSREMARAKFGLGTEANTPWTPGVFSQKWACYFAIGLSICTLILAFSAQAFPKAFNIS